MNRTANVRRTTGETDVEVRIDLDGTGVAEARDRSNSENPPAHGRQAQPADVRIPQADLSSARPNPTMSTTRGNMI